MAIGKIYKAPKINQKPRNQRNQGPRVGAQNNNVGRAPAQPNVPPPPPRINNQGGPNPQRQQQAQQLLGRNAPPPPPPALNNRGNGLQLGPNVPPPPPNVALNPAPQQRVQHPGGIKEITDLRTKHTAVQQQIQQLQNDIPTAPPQAQGKMKARLHSLQSVEGKMQRASNELNQEVQGLPNIQDPVQRSQQKGEMRRVAKLATGLPEKFNQSVDQWYDQAQVAANTPNPQTQQAKNKLYLGRFGDLKRHTGWTENNGNWDNGQVKPYKEARRLDAENWDLGVNEAFVQGGIDRRARFKFKTPLTQEARQVLQTPNLTGQQFLARVDPSNNGNQVLDPNLWDSQNQRPTVTAREIAQLLDGNYEFNASDRNQQKHPGEQKYQMLPK